MRTVRDSLPERDADPLAGGTMIRLLTAICVIGLVLIIVACGSASLSGTTWDGVIGLTEVSVRFVDSSAFQSRHLGNGTYSVDGDQVTLHPSGMATRVFVLDGSILRGTVDGWPVTLTKQ
jgi:hypothetical protein